MGNTYSKIYIHLIFSTKNLEPLIKPEFEERLKAYMAGIAKQMKIKTLAIGGMRNHMHMLLVVPPSKPISRVVQFIKGGSSRWLNKHFFEESTFRWQKGYGAFSVNESLVQATVRYIQNQEQYHADQSYRKEFVAILAKHDIDYEKTG